MPLDGSQYISEFNLSNPNGAVDTVDMLDDFIREVKRAVQQSFPNINKRVDINSDALNNLAQYLKYSNSTWDFQTVPLLNVSEADDDTAVEPRLYNDGRYLMVTEPEDALKALSTGVSNASDGFNSFRILAANMLYPVGTVYINASVATNPGQLFGVGTWAQFSPGRVLVGVGTGIDSRNQSRTFTNGQTGGEYEHVLSINEMPSHSHSIGYGGSVQSGGYDFGIPRSGNSTTTSSTGGNAAHNNVQPYLAVHYWLRTA